MLERLFLTIALVLPATALGQTAGSVPRPEVKLGDSWTYIRSDGYTKQITGTFVNTVQKIEAGEITVEARSPDGQGNPQLSVFTSDWNVLKRGTREFGPAIPQYAFPLEIGKHWEGNYTGPAPDGTGLVDYSRKSKVVGVETVTVPAGKFTATKIQAETTWLYKGAFRGGRSSGEIAETIWYAPEAKRFVKMEVETFHGAKRGPDRIVWELKELKLN